MEDPEDLILLLYAKNRIERCQDIVLELYNEQLDGSSFDLRYEELFRHLGHLQGLIISLEW